jgi:hypothetical protein
MSTSGTKPYRKEAISWVLHALKIVLGDESIRRYIIVKYNPSLTNSGKKYIRTFNAFVQKGKTRQSKADTITKYCSEIIKKKGIVVFTATNIQQNALDNETHFQTFIVDNTEKQLYIIDPAFDKTKEEHAGIYMAEVANEVVIPFFKTSGYITQFISLSNPAQIGDGDVFCQSWSLFILLQKIKNNEFRTNISFTIPKRQLDKYDMILSFYKQLFTDFPELADNLKAEYEAEIISVRGPNAPTNNQKQSILQYNPVELLMSMSKHDMQ